MTRNAHAEAHAHGQPHDHTTGPDATPHVGWKKYVVVGVILSVVTAMEVAAVETHVFPPHLVVPILLVLTAAKFFLVVLYYMHLKMDHAIFGRVFWAPMFLSVLVVVGLILLFHVVPTWGKFSN
ncbi:MAG TPA: cytochrome C oxidase subunit IV family protein [Longimicrobiales bacterium]|nr:cytochrome C oxidase subunit IV family protein [Longimicrobiales bacterium]